MKEERAHVYLSKDTSQNPDSYHLYLVIPIPPDKMVNSVSVTPYPLAGLPSIALDRHEINVNIVDQPGATTSFFTYDTVIQDTYGSDPNTPFNNEDHKFKTRVIVNGDEKGKTIIRSRDGHEGGG